jgi:hypothetical protein
VDNAAHGILDGAMPPDRYTMIHRRARLTDDEADRLVAALQAMGAGDDGAGDDGGSDDGGGDD